MLATYKENYRFCNLSISRIVFILFMIVLYDDGNN